MTETVLSGLLALLVAAAPARAAKAVTPLRPAPTPPDTESVLPLHGAYNDPGEAFAQHAERLAARTATEARRHSNQHGA
jgi:hypothetical protein